MKENIKKLKDIACQRVTQVRFRGLSQNEKARLNHELKIIEQTGTARQFSDIIATADKAAEQGGFYAIGAANCSFLLYCAGATTINPLSINSPFERYINPLTANSDFKPYYEISRITFAAPPESEDIYLDEAIYKRAKDAQLINSMLMEISKNYPPADNYQFVKEALEDSDGIIIWQEQIIELLHRMGGFSYAEADIIRRDGAKGLWKNTEWYSPRRKRFSDHAAYCGYDLRFADRYFRYIFEANMYARLKAAVAAQVLFE